VCIEMGIASGNPDWTAPRLGAPKQVVCPKSTGKWLVGDAATGALARLSPLNFSAATPGFCSRRIEAICSR